MFARLLSRPTAIAVFAMTLPFAPATLFSQSQSNMNVSITPDGQLIGPGRGLTRDFEIHFMEFTIDHHFSALRMTELAAGTDVTRNAGISPNEGTSPTPGFPSTSAKADMADLKSLARRNNRMQREEILMLQMFLHDWYGINYQPKFPASARPMLDLLDNAQPGKDFDHVFFEVLSQHHADLLDLLNRCLTGAELLHPDLHRACNDMWHSQTADIDDMRRELSRHFGIVDYQPFKDPRGQHSSPEPK